MYERSGDISRESRKRAVHTGIVDRVRPVGCIDVGARACSARTSADKHPPLHVCVEAVVKDGGVSVSLWCLSCWMLVEMFT
jgi:hypothetical protein